MNNYDEAMEAVKIIGAIEYLVNTSKLDERTQTRIMSRLYDLTTLVTGVYEDPEEVRGDVDDQRRRDCEEVHGLVDLD